MENVSRRLCELLCSTTIFYSLSLSHAAAASFNEGFESPDNTIAQLQSEGWTFINNSSPQGTPATGWVIDNDSASLGERFTLTRGQTGLAPILKAAQTT